MRNENNDKIIREAELANRWLMITVGTLVAIALAVVLTFVYTKSVVLSEITKQTVNIQQQELKRWEQLIEILPGGVALVDFDTTRIVYANEGFRTLTQRKSSDLLGVSILTLVPDDVLVEHRSRLTTDREISWEEHGFQKFMLKNGRIKLPDGTESKHTIMIIGHRLDGGREWLIFIDPRKGIKDGTPQSYDEIKDDVQLLLDTITGKKDLEYLRVAVAATEIIQYALHLLGADDPPVIGAGNAETLSAAQWTAINNCLDVCDVVPPKGGFLASLAIQRILKELVKQLMALIEGLLDDPQEIGELGDGTILRILLENLPQILAAILALFNKDK